MRSGLGEPVGSVAQFFQDSNLIKTTNKLLKYAALSGVAVASPAFALDPASLLNYRMGPLQLRPQLEMKEVFDSNVYYREKNIKSDLVSTLSPGVEIQLGQLYGNYATVNYSFNRNMFLDNTVLDSDGQKVEFKLKLDTSKTSLSGVDRYETFSDVLGGGTSLGRKVNREAQYHEYTLEYLYSPKTSIYARGTLNEMDFEKGTPLYNSNDMRAALGAQYFLFTRLAIFTEGYYGQTAVSPNTPTVDPAHSSFYGGSVGVRGYIGNKTVGMVRMGYQTRSFADSTPGLSAPVVDISLNHRFTERLKLNWSYSRKDVVSVQFARESYISDQIDLRLDQSIGASGKWKAYINGTLEHLSYEKRAGQTSPRDDLWVRGGGGVSCQFTLWMTGSLGYEYENFASNLAGVVDYSANRIMLRLAIGY